ncbi:MAG: polyprenyl synthetase family protein [Myxococcota bacterium]
MIHLSPRPTDSIDGLQGLAGSEGLDEAIAVMDRLALGVRVDRVGTIAREHLAGGGKRMRARLALAAVEALGGERTPAAPWAAACELLHNATLIHDDLQDGDAVRRGQPAVWARHGAAQAINAGDLLLMLPTLAVGQLGVPDGTKWRLARAVVERAEATVRGQAYDLELLASDRLTWHDWSTAARGKSGELLALPVEGAAHLCGLSEATARGLAEPFAVLGIVYQACDDRLDLYGDKGRGGPGSDLREGKVSVLVVEHLRRHPEDRQRLVEMLSAARDATSDDEVGWWIERFRVSGTVEAVDERIRSLERQILGDPRLRAVPDLHDVANTLLGFVRPVEA